MKYAGIGSRKADDQQLALATKAAKYLNEKGYTLRSGGAEGMDTAFAAGAIEPIILRPHHASEEAMAIAERLHPAWHFCTKKYVRQLLARNVQIILGKDLDDPVDFVLFWCPDPTSGGTSMGLKVAKENNIPIHFVEDWVKENVE